MKIYLAGPDVFFPDAAALADAKRAACARHGATGVFPTDPIESAEADAAGDRWYEIYLRNEAHIRACDAVLANLTPFRGPSADAGTVYEVGLMRGLGRPVAGYSNSAESFRDRSIAFLGAGAARDAEGGWADPDGAHLEDFGLADNLMIDGGIRAAGGLLVVRDVPGAARWRDLGAFEQALAALLKTR